MSMRGAFIDEELRAELVAVATDVGCELLHVEFRGGILRLVLDHPNGVSHDHCSRVSREASALLDAHEFGRGRYILEVSSPGLDRPLYGAEDYQRFLGRMVRVTFEDPDSGARRTVLAQLRGFDPTDGGTVTLATPAEESQVLPLRLIRRARLEIEL